MNSSVDISEWIDRQKISGLQILVICLCGACALVEGFDAQNIGYVAPAVTHEWGLPAHSFTPAFMSGLVGLLIGCLVVAPIADRIGRKKVIIGSVIAFAVFSFLSAAATSLESLSILRFLTGLGVGGGMANAIALTFEFFPKRKRSAMTVIMFTGFPLGASLGGFLSAYLIPHFGWQSVFISGGILPTLLAALLVFRLPESIRHLVVHEDRQERLMAILKRINPHAVFAQETRFIITEERKSGLTVSHLFREGRALGTALIWIVFFMSLLDIYLIASWLPTVLHDAGISISVSVVVTAMTQLSGVVACLVVAPVLDRRGSLSVMLSAYLLAALGIAALGSVGTAVGWLMLAACAAGGGIVGGQVTANAFAAAFYPTYIRATGVGWALGIGRIGAVVGPGVGGIMLALHWSRPTIFLLSAVPALVALLAVVVLMRLERRKLGVLPQAELV
jgi:MFS transporter, AAHS family, 4-hydroxybenzoate transporter